MSPEQEVAAYRESLQQIARAVTTARRRASGMGVLPAGAGEDLMCDVEHAITSLIVLGVVRPVPPAGGPREIEGPHG